MCGIFAYESSTPPDPELLVEAAVSASVRGPHGYGWVTRSPDSAHHELGPVDPGKVRELTAAVVLGHARLATVGDWQDVAQLQPITAAGHALAHNGVVHNSAALGSHADTDSMLLAHLYATLRAAGHTPPDALTRLTKAASQQAWAIVVLDADGHLYAHRRYHPLYRHREADGVYLSSQPITPSGQLIPEDRPVLVQ
ncbi:hypothetical protein GCM10023196_037220 [Actinoallomurus vinaceus]|uniref:Glutamine amidotransferase type-2 domain-containing protein n=1 Tax=Actinoallomurus vinaceus TaxID=1080074 RepID=A0ABP8UCZ9_9ACTN